jgi:site-specific recombinase XerD
VSNTSEPLEEAIFRWIKAEAPVREWSEVTCKLYRAQADAFAKVVGAKRPVESITGPEIESWVLGNVAPNTRRQRRKVLYLFFGWLARTGQVTVNPTADLTITQSTKRDTIGASVGRGPGMANLELLGKYRRDCQRRDLSPRTIDVYRTNLVLWITWLGTTPVLDAKPGQVESWIDSRDLAGRSRYQNLSLVSSFYRWAMRNELTERDPTALIPRPKVRQGMPRPIQTDDLELAIGQADARMRLWLLLAAYQGLRCKEIAGIRTDDLLLEREPPMLLVSSPKGRRERLLPVHADVETALRRFTGQSRQRGHTNQYLFPFPAGSTRAIRPEYVSTKINAYLRYLGIDATAHQLRHWFGTEVYGASRDLRMTQQLLGHSSPTTTAIYADWSPGEAVGIVQGLGR